MNTMNRKRKKGMVGETNSVIWISIIFSNSLQHTPLSFQKYSHGTSSFPVLLATLLIEGYMLLRSTYDAWPTHFGAGEKLLRARSASSGSSNTTTDATNRSPLSFLFAHAHGIKSEEFSAYKRQTGGRTSRLVIYSFAVKQIVGRGG
nr:uncharacterized protein LOC126532032 [Dermacentor andersoni]